MRSSKQAKSEIRGISGHFYKLHQRLHHALSLGTRVHDGKESKWQCTDIEIQRHVVRSIASFLDCISGDTAYHPLVKESVADMIGALVWILQNRSKAILSMAANVVAKLINVIPNVLLQPYLLDLVHPLSSLLPSHQVESVSCATALNMILSNLSMKREKQVWNILVETRAVFHIAKGIKTFPTGAMSIEYFLEMAALLSTTLHLESPQSRYLVWSDALLLEVLELVRVKPDISVKVAVLKLYSAIALCNNGANKLLENGEALLQMMVLCMHRSYPLSVRTEGFRLAQCLARNEQGCLTMLSLYSEPIVKSIIEGMSGWTSYSGKIVNEEMSLLVEACRLALISRWAGQHHDIFWKQRIDRVLLNLLVKNFHEVSSPCCLELEEQISTAQKGLKAKFLLALRPYVWDVLAWLATHCREDFNSNLHGHELELDILITCACTSFVDSIRKGRQVCQNDVSDSLRDESASRAVLMLIHSPSKYISLRARVILYELLKPTSKENLKHSLHVLQITTSKDNLGNLDLLQISVNLMTVVCYSSLQQCQNDIVTNGGMKTLMCFVKWCLSNDVHTGRLSLAPHLHPVFSEKTCCWVYNEDWENKDTLLLYGLWGLSELIHSGSVRNNTDIFVGSVEHTETEFVSKLQEICNGISSPGVRWHAALILSYFGIYGFPCKLGRCIGKALNRNEYADMRLIVANGESVNVHGVILAVRCPSLLPSEELPHYENACDVSASVYDTEGSRGKFHKEIRLSSHVHNQALAKLMEFVYMGVLNAGEEIVKKVRVLAKRCSLQPLLMMLDGRRPKWGTCYPRYDLSVALSPAGHWFSDIVLEAKATESVHWQCSICSELLPHIHAHKVVLWSRCDYLRALFDSGMTESNSQTIKVPISWEAMIKLVNWCYTDELPSPPSGCLWDNMDSNEKLSALKPYLELCWLAEFWFMEDVQDISYRLVVSCLDSARHLSTKLIKVAADYSLWKLVEVTASYLAPLYRELCQSGDLEGLDEEVIDMIREASVQLSREK